MKTQVQDAPGEDPVARALLAGPSAPEGAFACQTAPLSSISAARRVEALGFDDRGMGKAPVFSRASYEAANILGKQRIPY